MEVPFFTNEFDLAHWLAERGLPVAAYGQEKAKTIRHLLTELRQGECSLFLADGVLCRRILSVRIDIICDLDGRRLKLVEDRQEFRDGRVRRRGFDASCSEKLVAGEDPLEAARRAIAEELGIAEPVELQFVRTEQHSGPSRSYPGFHSHHEAFWYQLVLPAHLYRPEFVEEQPDKRTVFVWLEL